MKKDNFIINFIKGFIIGFGIIFPVSSSALAMIMGIYEKLINIINNFFKEFKNNKNFIISFALGVVVSAITCCLILNITLRRYPVATLLFFVGLIAGGLPMIMKKTNKDYKLSNIICFIIGILLLLSISLISNGKTAVITNDFTGYIKVLFAGILSAGAMIIPGASGSMILITIGYYAPLIELINETMHFTNLGSNILVIMVFGIGMLIGIVLMSKIMGYLLKKHERKTYFAIVGFIIASIINLIIMIFGYKFKIIEFIIGLILFTIGYLISAKYLGHE